MQQEQKESLIGKILKALIVQFGAELVEQVFSKHKEDVQSLTGDPVSPPTGPKP